MGTGQTISYLAPDQRATDTQRAARSLKEPGKSFQKRLYDYYAFAAEPSTSCEPPSENEDFLTTRKAIFSDGEEPLDLVLNSEEGGDLSDFIMNGEWYLIEWGWHYECNNILQGAIMEFNDSIFERFGYLSGGRDKVCTIAIPKNKTPARCLRPVLRPTKRYTRCVLVADTFNRRVDVARVIKSVALKPVFAETR
ncbi:hypothetical protein DBV15_03074 [Temnothorax longispinosus]|uniref:Uncharacterized protein n=1 Tax=Temnothorax longispinosus TaxID=300112 RepID=A0A4S2KJ03_9HYME|nr:hypothetical protein DBV15_03074 [Temnothorax longispinosus]